jgi:hypothetical protein
MTSVPARAIRRGAIIAAIAWVPWATGIVLTNVVFPARQDHDGLWVPIGYLFVFAALALAGLSHTSGRRRVTAGAAAGAIFGLLTIATFALVDNLFLQIVGQQQAKIEGLRDSGMTSMRAYINSSLVPAGVVMTLEFAVLGIVLAAVAGAVYDLRRPRAQGLS